MSTPPPAADLQVDFPFDYAAHVAGGRRIGRLPTSALGTRVAVIGTGGSGLTAAYELLRVGCTPILYEAERSPGGPGGRRLGGRMHSQRLAPADSAVVELGCMRAPDSARLLRHYADLFGLHWQPFRDEYVPGTTPRTVLDIDGRTRAVREISDLYPGDEVFRQAHTRWLEALERIGLTDLRRAVAARDPEEIRRRWAALLGRYEQWTFHRFLLDPDGARLTWEQARVLGTAGVGTAAWDCFFGLAFTEVMRLLLTTEGAEVFHLREGMGAVADGFWNHRTGLPDGRFTSLAEVNDGAPRPGVVTLEVGEDTTEGVVVHDEDGRADWFPAAVFTPQLHVLETSVRVRPLRPGGAPPFGPRLLRAIRRLSYWQSAKTVLVTETPFWTGTSLDGVTLTDRLPRATYTMDFGEPREPGGRRSVLVLSFTWAEDSMKVASSTLQERVGAFVDELCEIHPEVAEELRRQVAAGATRTISWEEERNFKGICRFSRPGEYPYQWDLFSHFVKDAAGVPGEPANPLFLAGDDVSWSPGWLDHAMASGLNAAWGVLHCLGGKTTPDNPGPGDVWQREHYRPLTPAEVADRQEPNRPPTTTSPRDTAHDGFVVTADRLWDGERMRPAAEARVLVRQGRVKQVGAGVTGSPTAESIDLPGHTLLPGLIDCHVHVLDESLNTASVGEQTLRALPAMRTLLDNGFTTVRDLGSADYPSTIDLRQAVKEGLVVGPRLLTAPNIISARGGHGDKEPDLTTRFGIEVGTLADGTAEVIAQVRKQVRAGADWIKFAASGGFGTPSDHPAAVTYTQAEMTALVAAATDLGLPCAVHAFNDEAVRRAVRAGVRSVEHANLVGADTLALLAERGVPLVPTLYVVFHHVDRLDDEDFWEGKPGVLRAKFRDCAESLRSTAALLADSDVVLAFGTDASVIPYADTWREFPTMARVGIGAERILRSATSVAADLLRQPDLGRVRPGAVGDLVAVPGDPTEDMGVMGEVDFVMQGGTVRKP
ncbi:amidohydrolase family protein [Actinokineospora sp. PR83]|uniref:amidohydrolase family protein n=1 Tax=Actinokineospora sp. PR83 TaxID=2884908 RepID=UPI0027DFAF56|nr:amidohydrolase family protein [Actinokineospora sp. PR83]MCG8918138.1 amidohydrolase family protein [Actinokineospora sp. PR83]